MDFESQYDDELFNMGDDTVYILEVRYFFNLNIF